MDVNYFDAQHVAMNTINHQQIVDSADLENDDIPELLDNDTGEKTRATKTFQSQRKVMVMTETPYCTSKGTRKKSSSIQLLMTPLMTR